MPETPLGKHYELGALRSHFYVEPMRPARVLIIYIVLVFFGGALAAPWLYQAVQAAAPSFPALQTLSHNPFHRFVHRSMLILAVAGLWPLCRLLGLRRWADAGFARERRAGRGLAAGCLTGFLSLGLIALLICAAGVRRFDFARDAHPARTLLVALLTAAVVAPLEELLFRGALFGGLRRAHPWKISLLASSALYALVHFFSRPESPSPIDAFSGLVVLERMLHGFVDPQILVPGFFNLLVAGAILGMAYQRTGSLYFSIGLHAGWIFCLKAFAATTTEVRPSWLWGGERLIDGWIALLVLSCLFFLVARRPELRAGESK